jgi:UDP-glucose 4-epimerase
MQKAIVFGANGYLGRHIAYFLKQNRVEFIPVDIANKSIDGFLNYQKIDVTDIKNLQQLDFNVDYVFVFAGLTGTGGSPEITKKFTKVNEQGLANVINCCEGIKGLRIIFPSTRLVYKGIENTPLLEESKKEHKTIYAKNKIACEHMLERSIVDYTIFRICVPYGNLIDSNYSYGTIGFFIEKASKGENITIYGDGGLKRTFTHVRDIVQSIFKSVQLKSTINDVYNIGSNDALSLLEVANLVAQKYGVKVEFVDWPEEALKIESGDTIFDDRKLKKVTNYKYQHSLKQWIDKI